MPRSNLLATAAFLGLGLGLRPVPKPASTLPALTAPPDPPADPATTPDPDPVPATPPTAEVEDDVHDPDCDCDEDDPNCECDEQEMSAGTVASRARVREQARIAAILADPAASGRTESALSLALNTRMPRSQAITLLATLPKGRASIPLDAQMAGLQAPPPGSTAISAAQKMDALWGDAFKKNAISEKYKPK